MTHIAFVASSDTHVDLFAPVMAEVARRGSSPYLASLDSLYNQSAADRAKALGWEARSIAPDVVVRGHFYRRNALVIWLDVIRIRHSVIRWLQASDPGVVVMGNDRGLVEKLIIHTAHRHGCRVMLVQDGSLAPRPGRGGMRTRPYDLARRIGSVALRASGLPYLAASEYGQGGTDLLCASGPDGAQRLLQLGVDPARIVITGQPRFDPLRDLPAPTSRRGAVTMFTTPFEHAGIGVDLQRRQVELAAALSQRFSGLDISFVVKPHPRESLAPYREALGDSGEVREGRSIDALRDCRVAIIGTSTVVDEAGLIGVPVVVPGQLVHAGRFNDQLPNPDTYPRFEDVTQAVSLVSDFNQDGLARAALQRRQREAVLRRVYMDPVRPAAALIADAAESLIG